MKASSCYLTISSLAFCISANISPGESAFFMTPSLRDFWDEPGQRPPPYIALKSERTPYAPTQWSLYEYDQPQARDLKQGQIGNCFLAQTLKAIAYAKPKFLKSNIPMWDEKEGQFVVLLFNLDRKATDIAVDLVMDVKNAKMGGTFDPDSDERFSIPRTSAETKKTIMWPIVFEKAVVKALHSPKAAQLFGILGTKPVSKKGYAALDAGGYADMAMTMLTGMKFENFETLKDEEENYGKFVTFLMDHKGLPIVLASKEDENIENTECTRPGHAHPVGRIDFMNLRLEILCDNHSATGKFFPFAAIYEMMTYVISVEAEKKYQKLLHELPDVTAEKRNPLGLIETTELVAPVDRYDAASTVIEFCKSKALECGQQKKSATPNTYEVILQSPHSLQYKKSHWDRNNANFNVTVNDSVPDLLVQPKSKGRLFAHSATATGATEQYSIPFAVLCNSIQKLGNLLIPDFETLGEKEKFLHYVQMLDTTKAKMSEGIYRPLQNVMVLKKTYRFMPCNWPVGAFLIPIEEQRKQTILRCGTRTVNVKKSNIDKYFEKFQVSVLPG